MRGRWDTETGRWVVVVACALGLSTICGCGNEDGATGIEAAAGSPEERVRRLLAEVPLIDGHNDLPWQYRMRADSDIMKLDVRQPQPEMHTDIPRLREGAVGAQFWSVFVPTSMEADEAVRATLEQIDLVHRLTWRYPDVFELALSADDIERIHEDGKIASLIGMEGGHSINSSIGVLRMMYRLGARYMTLTHSRNTPWADSATDDGKLGGLNELGEEIVREMNRIGMLVDISHVSPETMHDVLGIVQAPVIFSHSSARGVTDHARNAPDDVLPRLADNGGVVMITFVGSFISEGVRAHGKLRDIERDRLRQRFPEDAEQVREALKAWDDANPRPRATLADVADHIDHVRDKVGIDHIGIGGDYDGTSNLPDGLDDVSKYVDLMVELQRRGYSDEDIQKLAGGNLLRVFREVERVSAEIRAAETRS